jgi:hypothetical protein
MEGGTVQCLGPFPMNNIPPEDDGNVHCSVGTTATDNVRKDIHVVSSYVCDLILIKSVFMS